MRRVSRVVSIYLPNSLYSFLYRAKQRFLKKCSFAMDIRGDRDIEYSWIAAYMPQGPGEALDFGSGKSYMSLIAARRGYQVIALDLEPRYFYWMHPRVNFIQGDLLKIDFPANSFDLVINCSTVEHVGLTGRFSVRENRPQGDLEAMQCLLKLMKIGGLMLLTIPLGQDRVFAPFCRVYGHQRLPELLKGFIVEKEDFWIKHTDNRWYSCDKKTALGFQSVVRSIDPKKNIYALGCFLLRRAD